MIDKKKGNKYIENFFSHKLFNQLKWFFKLEV